MTTQSSPGGYLVKDFADGWYWTPNAASAHEGGAAVWSIEDNRYETVPPALAIPPAATEDAHRTMDGETVWGFKVAAWRYVGPQDPDDARFGHRYCEHWSTIGNAPKKVERLFTEDQLRAALSAAPAPEGGVVKDWDAIRSHPCYDEHQPGCDCAALATRGEAPAEAGERNGLAAELDRLADCEGGMRGGSERAAETMRQAAKCLRAQPQAREDAQPVAWTPWHGGENPVPGQMVHVLQVAGQTNASPMPSEHFGWSFSGLNEDIIGYRLAHPAPDALRVAVTDIAAERQRQVDVEGWSEAHDDEHDGYQMARAAGCYAFHASREDDDGDTGMFVSAAVHHGWPWDRAWWKPKSRRADLVRAGALIVAEIERLDRAALQAEQGAK